MAELTPVDPSTVQETGPEPTSQESYIQRLEDEIGKLTGGHMFSDINAPVPGSRTPVPGTRPEQEQSDYSAPSKPASPVSAESAPSAPVNTSEPNQANPTSGRPLLEGVAHPVDSNGAPDMKEPGAHQNPVSYAHLSNGDVVKIAGLVPTYIHDGEELLKVLTSSPMLMADGKQMLAGLLKSL